MKKKLKQNTSSLLLAVIVFIAGTSKLHSQSIEDFPSFGSYLAEETHLKKCDFDKEANAVILFDIGKSYYNDQHNLVTERRTRLKILNAKGLEYADVAIPYYKKDNFEFISNINAITTNFDEAGKAYTAKLSGRNVYDKKVNDLYSEMRFSMPEAKAGSIIEYKYVSTKNHYGGLEDWYFQTHIPTLKSAYYLVLLPNSEFAYRVFKSPALPITIDKSENSGSIYFEMKNIAGLHDEPFMDSRTNNLQHVTFQLAAFIRSNDKTKYFNSWNNVASQLLKDPDYGGQLNKNLSGTDELITKTKALHAAIDKVKAIYEFVQKRIGWNGITSKYTENGIKKAWDKGVGMNGEINLIFLNLLQSAGITAYPLLASDRWHGKVDLDYPFIDQFNKTIAYVEMPNGRPLIIDVSDKNTPIHMMPFSLLNTYGYIVGKKKKGLILLEDKNQYSKNEVILTAVLSSNGVLSGTAGDNSYDYERLERKNFLGKNGKQKFLERYFKAAYTNLAVDSLVIENLDNDSLCLTQHVNFRQTLNTSGDYAFIDCHLFSGIGKNPFTDDIRFSDINFGSPHKYSSNQVISLPGNFTVDAVPQNIKLITPDTAFTLVRRIEIREKQILSQVSFEIRNSYYEVDDYPMLKEFFKKMYDMLDEQIVLKKKSS